DPDALLLVIAERFGDPHGGIVHLRAGLVGQSQRVDLLGLRRAKTGAPNREREPCETSHHPGNHSSACPLHTPPPCRCDARLASSAPKPRLRSRTSARGLRRGARRNAPAIA